MDADSTSKSGFHTPVMLEETLFWLDVQPGQTVVDATIGFGGHSGAFAHAVGPEGRLIGLDLDPTALNCCRAKSASWPCRTDFAHAGSDELDEVLEQLGVREVDRIFADLGVSSLQIDEGSRGFSFRSPGPLDMRMNPEAGFTAAEWLAEASEREIRGILREYGEEIRAHPIARAVVRERAKAPIETTERLCEIILGCFPDREKAGRVHPATRAFQALRIVVNRELDRLEGFLAAIPRRLALEGRAVVLAYHSLEDRLVKQSFHQWAGKTDSLLDRLPIQGRKKGWATLLNTRVVRPGETEIEANPRARSARLRAMLKNSSS